MTVPRRLLPAVVVAAGIVGVILGSRLFTPSSRAADRPSAGSLPRRTEGDLRVIVDRDGAVREDAGRGAVAEHGLHDDRARRPRPTTSLRGDRS